jgi:hypothetical protein
VKECQLLVLFRWKVPVSRLKTYSACVQQYMRSRVDQAADALQFGSPTAVYQQVFSPSMRRRQSRSILTLIGRQETEVAPFYDRLEAARKQETELIHALEREILTRLFSRIVATYQGGSPVTFGQLQISTKGISDGKVTLPWNDVDQITLRGEVQRFLRASSQSTK